jgi:Arc/MetJ family transcription regulator
MFGRKKIPIDAALYDKVARFATAAGYPSVEDFVRHLLEREVKALEVAGDDEDVRKRLRGLGYLE